MRQADKSYQVEAIYIKETEKAVRIIPTKIEDKVIPEDEQEGEWFPKSQLVDYTINDTNTDEPSKFVMKEWILKEKGYI